MPPSLCAAALFVLAGAASAQTVYTVNATADPGSGVCDATECTLREAILAANATPNGAQADRIHFAIPGTGLKSITPVTALPAITDPVVIDAYTQPGASPNTLAVGNDAVVRVELNGNGAAFRAVEITAGGSTVRGLVINRFDGNGATDAFQLRTAGGNTIAGNWVGTSADGATAQNNSRAAIYMENSAGNTVGGAAPADRNVLLGALNPVIYDAGTGGGHTIQGNYIGTDAQGRVPLGQTGIYLSTGTNTIGGTVPGAGNVISVTGRDGVVFLEGGAAHNRVQGNFIGVGADGTTPLGGGTCVLIQRGSDNLVGGGAPAARNLLAGASGVRIVGDGGAAERNRVQGNWMGLTAAGTALVVPGGGAGTGVAVTGAVDTAIGGTGLGEGNLIAGYAVAGVRVDFGGAPNAAHTRIQANWIGTDANGSAALGNATGVLLFGAAPAGGTVVGGPGGGNVISGNRGDGVLINGPAALTVQDNLVGVGGNGSSPLGNGGSGIVVAAGGTHAITGNVVAYNGDHVSEGGVRVAGGTGTTILGNALYANVGYGIDLLVAASPGPTPNDPGDADEGPNRLQNTPEAASALLVGGQITLAYRVDTGLANAAYPLQVEIFWAADGQGAALAGRDTYAAVDHTGCGAPPCTKTIAFSPASAAGQSGFLVLTATDLDGNTSEFSAEVDLTGGVATEAEGPGRTTLELPSPNPSRGRVTVRYALAEPGPARLAVLDALGREVVVLMDGARPAGPGAADLDTSALAAGPYTVRLGAGAVTQSRRLVVIR